MNTFNNIIGQEQLIHHLKSSVSAQKISHAYIFYGDKGMGKKTLASAFSALIQCESHQEEPCGQCKSCIQVASSNHPDIKWVTHEKPLSISVEEVRKQINQDIDIKPYQSNYKIYIIDEAEKLTVQAQNALLKSIEEPPAYVVMILLATDKEKLLQTIKSRCVALELKQVNQKEIQSYLMNKCAVEENKASMMAVFSQGNLGKAIYMSSSEDFVKMYEELMYLLKRVKVLDIYEIIEQIQRLMQYQLEVYEIIDLMMVWYRDIILLKATKDFNLMIFKDEYLEISRQEKLFSFEGLEKIINAMEKAKVRLRANVNFELAMELMLLTIKEN